MPENDLDRESDADDQDEAGDSDFVRGGNVTLAIAHCQRIASVLMCNGLL